MTKRQAARGATRGKRGRGKTSGRASETNTFSDSDNYDKENLKIDFIACSNDDLNSSIESDKTDVIANLSKRKKNETKRRKENEDHEDADAEPEIKKMHSISQSYADSYAKNIARANWKSTTSVWYDASAIYKFAK